MVAKWTRASVGDLADSISQTHSFDKEQLIFLNTSDIFKGTFLHRSYSPVKDFPGQAKKSIREDDILLSEIRPANGRYAFVNTRADDYVVSTKLMVIRVRERVVPRYLYHFLTNKQTLRWLQHLAESRSGTFPQITFEQVSSLAMNLPPKEEQKAIVAFIDSLDDKIELNRRTNETLEEMARALFRSWFVDFDPVSAKMEGHQPYGMHDKTAALFPDSFEESVLGEIPKGWSVESVGDVVRTVGGGTPSTKDPAFWEGGTHCWATPRDLSKLQSPILLDTERKVTDAGVAKISHRLLPKEYFYLIVLRSVRRFCSQSRGIEPRIYSA